jgi:hypothetical protein
MTVAWNRIMKNRLVQAYQQAPWRIQLQWIGLFLLALLLVASVAGIYLSISSNAGTAGREVQILQTKIEDDQRSIADKSSTLAFLTSSAQMDKRAIAMGFQPVDPDAVTYLVVPGYTPRGTADLAPQPGQVLIQPPLVKPSYTQSLLEWIFEKLSSATQNQGQAQK